LSKFDEGLAIGLVLGKSQGGGSAECDAGRLDIETAIEAKGVTVVKVGAIPTFPELVTGVDLLPNINFTYGRVTYTTFEAVTPNKSLGVAKSTMSYSYSVV
jgi:hypothetical protein